MPFELDVLTLSVALLIVLAVAFTVAAAWGVWRSGLTPTLLFLYWVNQLVNAVLWRTRSSGPLPIGRGQGAVIICNHVSPLDPCYLQVAAGPRVVHWMVAKEYFAPRIFGWFLRTLECIPVGRAGVDIASTKMAIRYAQSGELVGMFPEGRINTTERLLLPGRPGAAMVALKARVPVIPCFLSGVPASETPLGPLRKPARIRVIVGRPFELTEYYGREKEDGVREELAKRMLTEIAALSDVRDYVPELAGRRWKHAATDEPVAATNDENHGDTEKQGEES